MKTILIFLIFASSLHAELYISSEWSPRLEKEIVVECREESFCSNYCGDDERCIFKEQFCRDCAGTSLYMKKLFSEMGQTFRNSERVVGEEEFFQFLDAGNYVSLTSKSIYNFVTSYDALELRMEFRSLCGFLDPYPIVFLETIGGLRRLGRVRYVACNLPELTIMEMEEVVEINLTDLL